MDPNEGQNNLAELIQAYGDDVDRNEAQTRFDIIDSLILDCLGWEKGDISVEKRGSDGLYTDYELGQPRAVIWEAKREGIQFELPPESASKRLIQIPSLCIFSKELKSALEQVQGYCSRRGVQVAVACNGRQLVAFMASRHDGIDPLTGKALVFDSLQDMHDNFSLLWEMLSKDGVKERRVVRYLAVGEISVPSKVSSKIPGYPRVKIPDELQANLRQLSELLIQDIIESEELEELFLSRCYSDSGALSHYAMLSRTILEARYSAMFSQSEASPKVVPATRSKKKGGIDPDLMSEAMAKRPIVLIGDVGVGKTSFVKNLIYNAAREELENSLYVYIDLGSKASMAESLKNYVLHEIEAQLLSRYQVDIKEFKFLKGVYASEISRFKTGLWGQKFESDPEAYENKLFEMIESKVSAEDEHLKRSFEHLSKARRKQVIVFLDNADQRDFSVQQEAFIISQELAKDWNAFVFVSVRPQTFYKSKQSGALSAYPHKVFTIAPPRIDLAIKKRLQFAIDMAEGNVPIELYEYVKLNSRSLAILLRVLTDSLERNKEINEFLVNITGGNVRAVVEIVTGFIGNPNVDSEKMIQSVEEGQGYLVPLHEFIKTVLFGDFQFYNPSSSIVCNIFDVSAPDPNEHFLAPILLSFLASDASHSDGDGFVASSDIYSELQGAAFSVDQIEFAIRRLANKKLIETPQRVTFQEDSTGLIGDIPSALRLTTVGAYHLNKWMANFAYMDAVLIDTPIFESEVVNEILERIDSGRIEYRFKRAEAFRAYLNRCWASYSDAPVYFDFAAAVSQESYSFDRVKDFVVRNRPGSI